MTASTLPPKFSRQILILTAGIFLLAATQAAGAKSAKIGNEEMSDRVRWIRSYVVKEPDGRIGSVCIYQARDAESIRAHARRVGMPGDQIFPVLTTVVVRDDPAEASAAA
jgi:hypothetical protein